MAQNADGQRRQGIAALQFLSETGDGIYALYLKQIFV